MEEDITQDPEYQRGYESGIEQYRRDHAPYMKGFKAGLRALETPSTVESKPTPTPTSKEREDWKARYEQLQQELEAFNKRLKELEKYTQE